MGNAEGSIVGNLFSLGPHPRGDLFPHPKC